MGPPVLQPDEAALRRACEVILRGGLVAIPTETVYGLAADATNSAAVARIFAAKGRPGFNPLICHVTGLAMAEELAVLPPLARQLAARFWPGPLTIVAPRRPDCPVADLATAGLASIALRTPDHPVAQALITLTGRPLAAPSANPSERLSPTTAAHVVEGLGDRVDLVLDGGPCRAGVESTIIAIEDDELVLLRRGALSRKLIEEAVGRPLVASNDETIRAPGMLSRHYSPEARLRLNATDICADETYLGFGPAPAGVEPTLNLSARGDLVEAAANLFAMLRELDRISTAIAVAPIPDEEIGEAINDRLQRAAANTFKVGV